MTYEYRGYFRGLVQLFCEIFGVICRSSPRRLFYFEGLEALFANLVYFYEDEIHILGLACSLGFSRKSVTESEASAAEYMDQISSPRDISKCLKDMEMQLAKIPTWQGSILCDFIESCMITLGSVLEEEGQRSEKEFEDCMKMMVKLFDAAFCGRRENYQCVDRWIQDWYLRLLKKSASGLPGRRSCILGHFKKVSQMAVSPNLCKSLYEILFQFHGEYNTICQEIFLDSLG